MAGVEYKPSIHCWLFSPKKNFKDSFHSVCSEKLKFDGSFWPYISGLINDKEYCYYGNRSGNIQWHYGIERDGLNDRLLDFATGYINTIIKHRFQFCDFGYYISDH